MPPRVQPTRMERDGARRDAGVSQMAVATIVKPKGKPGIVPNLPDYEDVPAPEFWERARQELGGLPGGRGLNIAHEAVDRHAHGPRAQATALRFLSRGGELKDLPYAELARLT